MLSEQMKHKLVVAVIYMVSVIGIVALTIAVVGR